jgi:hypothetical protein
MSQEDEFAASVPLEMRTFSHTNYDIIDTGSVKRRFSRAGETLV